MTHQEKINAVKRAAKRRHISGGELSRGVYGMTGAILQDENGERYAITARNSTLFQLV